MTTDHLSRRGGRTSESLSVTSEVAERDLTKRGRVGYGGGGERSYCQGSMRQGGAVTRRRSRRARGSCSARVEAAERSE